jgi:hypothetical protein
MRSFSEEHILIGATDFLSQFKKDSGKNILDFCFLGDIFFIPLRKKKIIAA